jgi:hypothetical protein
VSTKIIRPCKWRFAGIRPAKVVFGFEFKFEKNFLQYFSFLAVDGEESALSRMDDLRAKQVGQSET